MVPDPLAPVTLVHAGRLLGVAPSTLRHQIRKGKLIARKVGRDWVVDRREIDEYAREHLRRADPDPLRDEDGKAPVGDVLPVELLRAAADLGEAGALAARGRRREALSTADRVAALLEALVREK